MIQRLRENRIIIEYPLSLMLSKNILNTIKAIQEQLHHIQQATVGAAGGMTQNHPQTAERYCSTSAFPEFPHKFREEREQSQTLIHF